MENYNGKTNQGIKIKDIDGNKSGIPQIILQDLADITKLIIPRNLILNELLANKLIAISHKIKRELAIYIDRHGTIVYLCIGSNHNVDLINKSQRHGKNRLSGLRCIHTHPDSTGLLSFEDLSALKSLRFDCMLALGINKNGGLNGISLAFGVLEDIEPQILIFDSIKQVEKIAFSDKIIEIEKSAPKDYHHVVKKDIIEKAIVVAVNKNSIEEGEEVLVELMDLADTAGVQVVDKMVQKRPHPDNATYIGRGKIEELKNLCQNHNANLVIIDDELSPGQYKNLASLLNCKVIDRSTLILDIFAQRAKSNEGKLQVELAQLKYMLPRLVGQRDYLSRLGGGIGTRGPGETQLEVDRRKIRTRIQELERRLDEIIKHRELHRARRDKKGLAQIVIVGYTNAGKSCLLNALTDAETLIEDKLFATLDNKSRRLNLLDGQTVIITDTVGFINRLPHHLIAAFRATLEEAVEADLLLHVMDASNPEVLAQAEAVQGVLLDLGIKEKPILAVFNKIDKINNKKVIDNLQYSLGYGEASVAISAKEKINLEELKQKITQLLPNKQIFFEAIIPYSDTDIIAAIYREGKMVEKVYENSGVHVKAFADKELYQKIKMEDWLI